jgi:hypothetical protein
MKIKYIKQIEIEQEIELPYYFIDRVGNIFKAHEDCFIRIGNERQHIEIEPELIENYFNDRYLERFLDNQTQLKEEFEKSLSELIAKITK